MGEHYTKRTVEQSAWCSKCHDQTPHRVDKGRLGPCKVCLYGAQQPAPSGGPVEILTACPCNALPFAHVHYVGDRIAHQKKWNRESQTKANVEQ